MIAEPIDRIEITKEDITNIKIDAIVTTTTPNFKGGSGLDGKVQKVAGPELKKECLEIGQISTSEAKMTKSYGLPCKRVIHTVGPIFIDGEHSEVRILEMCYENCLKVLNDNECDSVAFPSISAGKIGFPVDLASKVAIMTTIKELAEYPKIKRVVFCCYTDEMYDSYKKSFNEIKKQLKD